MYKLNNSHLFKKLVDPVRDSAPGYFDIVKRPMAYVTVEHKFQKEQYRDPKEFVEDMRLIYRNAM